MRYYFSIWDHLSAIDTAIAKKKNSAEKKRWHDQLNNRKGYINKKHNLARTFRK